LAESSRNSYERMRGTGRQCLLATMAEARQEAAEQGLTDERLDQLLADES
jgi:hypothetical protein